MVDIKPRNTEVEWRPPDAEEQDPVEQILKGYDFQALHDRIMLALEIKPENRPALSTVDDKKRRIQ